MSTFERKQKAIDRDEVWNGISAILLRLYTFVQLEGLSPRLSFSQAAIVAFKKYKLGGSGLNI